MISEKNRVNLNKDTLNADKLKTLKIPGKTFLVGEYAVLCGGASLSLATKPCFTVIEDYKPVSSFHEFSAAGRLLKGKNLGLSIQNPYGVGGFGQSTAEFILAWISQFGWPKKTHDLFNDYLNLYNNEPSQRPSGGDLMTQLTGGVCYFKNADQLESWRCEWFFEQLGFFVVSTGLKVATHSHLDTLNRESLKPLTELSEHIIQSYFNKDQDTFIRQLKLWTLKLDSMGLQSQQVLELKLLIESNTKAVLVKPCGALGADVMIVFYNKNNSEDKKNIANYLAIIGLQIQADEDQLAMGVVHE